MDRSILAKRIYQPKQPNIGRSKRTNDDDSFKLTIIDKYLLADTTVSFDSRKVVI